MKIDVDEYNNALVLKEIYNGVILETAEGNKVILTMRDDTIELTVWGSDKWYRADMKTGDFNEL